MGKTIFPPNFFVGTFDFLNKQFKTVILMYDSCHPGGGAWGTSLAPGLLSEPACCCCCKSLQNEGPISDFSLAVDGAELSESK